MTESPVHSQTYQPTWESLDRRPIPNWFPNAKLGVFVHWGVYSVPAWAPLSDQRYGSYAEWYYARVMGELRGSEDYHARTYGDHFEYRDFGPLFKAERFDPDSWADLFAAAGARYVVLTSKHHDGYCLWPTQSSFKQGWNSSDIGPERDLVGELTAAVRRHGLKMGLYYSLVEWESNTTARTPSGRYVPREYMDRYGIPRDRYVRDHVLVQLRELVNDYQPAVLFADGGEWDEDDEYWKTKEFLSWLYNNAPNRDEVVVNDRWARGMPGRHGDYYSSEYRDTDAVGVDHPWEESRGIGRSYGYNQAEGADDYLTSQQLIHELVDVVSRGGNLLLNVGPTADGTIPLIMQRRLRDIGAWLRVNGDAIYSTRPWTDGIAPQPNTADKTSIRFTRKGSDLFVICPEWPTSDVRIQALRQIHTTTVELLGHEGTIDWRRQGDTIIIEPPRDRPERVPPSYAHVFKVIGVLS
ncbi:MAG: alpha-L-fucosidase [Gemmatimonadota bacterium]|nr:MAG: alpha-L-fucosidase [Gemmatimonadota bacterium]